MELAEFFRKVITGEKGYFCLAVGPNNGHGWTEKWFEWPSDLDKIVRESQELGPTNNVYFSSYLFKEPSSVKSNVLPTRTIQADLDEADATQLPIIPTILVQTSPGRHQAFWILNDGPLDSDTHEVLSRKITYAIPLCDRSGWALGRKVRVPYTNNFKYLDGPKPISIVGDSLKEYDSSTFELLPDVVKADVERYESGFLDEQPKFDVGPAELLSKYREKMDPKAYLRFANRDPRDRSAALFGLTTALFRVGAPRDEVFAIARGSANNKFAELRHHADRELAKDVLRAEQVVLKDQLDPRALIMMARKKAGAVTERRALVLDIVLDFMKQQGTFLHAYGDQVYYIRRDIGRPVRISRHSDYLDILLDLQYGLNSVEVDTHYVASGIYSYAHNAPETAVVSALTHFNKESRFLLLHTGRKDVLRITADTVEKVSDGSYGVVFPWNNQHEPFMPNLNVDPSFDWAHHLFVETIPDTNALANVLGLTQGEALAMLKVWTMFLLFRDLSASRPILAALGQPGCLSGDTVIGVRRGEHSERLYALEEIYERFGKKWDSSIPTRVLSLKDGVVTWRDVHDIVHSGVKQVFEVSVSGHGHIYATAEHRFLTPDGYKELSELKVGDVVITKGVNVFSNGKIAATRSIVKANYHPYARQKMVGKYGPYGNILRCRAVLEAALNGMTYEHFVEVVHTDPDCSLKLKFLPADVHIHHKDENPENDAPDNLVALSKLEHDTYHGHKNVENLGEWSGRFQTSSAFIVSIKPQGEVDTYDIQMEDDEAPNFLVNGVVVHNSGKTTLFKKLYRLLYGKSKAVASITSPEDFDHGVANTPFYAIDNVDSWERWLPDRLALSASISDIDKRKLYTDGDSITIRRQALVGLSAHNPKFGREDVADRLLILSFHRLAQFASEDDIYESVLRRRNDIWGAIVKDAQKVLAEGTPSPDEVPQFRIEDFAKVGFWIARALGCADQFSSGLGKTRTNQRAFSLEEDSLLVTAIRKLVASHTLDEPKPIGFIWARLETASDDPPAFARMYKNSVQLGKKLFSMEDSLKQQFDIRWTTEPDQPGRLWSIKAK